MEALTLHAVRRLDSNDQPTVSLVCFPPAGAGVAAFATWQAVGTEVGLYVACLPGRDHRRDEVLSEDLCQSAAEIAAELQQNATKLGKIVLFGHSLGGLLAFEVAQQLPQPPDHLFVAACAAPQLANPHPTLGDLPPAEFLPAVKARYGGFDERLLDAEEWVVEVIPRLRADLRMAEAYESQVRPLETPLTALAGSDDATITPAALLGWQKQTTRRFHHRWFPGGHFFPQTAAAAVVRMIREKVLQT